MQVVRIDDHGVLPVPTEHGDYRDGGGRPYRDDLKPIEVAQPEGTSLRLDGRALSWGPWRVRIGFNPRESLTLHELAFDAGDGAGPRPVAHRLSIAELAIPYADTNPTVVFKNAFDIGEYGLGPYVNSLALGCDCLGEIRYLDAARARQPGAVRRRSRTPSACTRRTRASSGSTSTGAAARPTSAARASS